MTQMEFIYLLPLQRWNEFYATDGKAMGILFLLLCMAACDWRIQSISYYIWIAHGVTGSASWTRLTNIGTEQFDVECCMLPWEVS